MSNNISRLYSFNQHADDQMGSDGCLQFNHKNNRGLDEIWAKGSPWKNLYDSKYSDWNVPDFWVAAATATIKISSNGRHDMWHTFMWGRKQRDSCSGSGDRLPAGKGCQDNQRVFLDNMGLTWKDVTALLGAHTVGRGQNKVRLVGLSGFNCHKLLLTLSSNFLHPII
jgi:hypothetical protein